MSNASFTTMPAFSTALIHPCVSRSLTPKAQIYLFLYDQGILQRFPKIVNRLMLPIL